MHSKNRDIREYPMELIKYFAKRPWDGVSIPDAMARDKTGLVEKAHDCSGGMHDKEFRGDGKPAKSHPEKVVKIIIFFGCDNPVILAAAYLHDAPEDIDDQILVFIEEGYPEKTFSIVFRVTKKEGMSDEEHFRLVIAEFASIIVKLADRLHNLRNMAKNLYFKKPIFEEGFGESKPKSKKPFTKKRLYKYIKETERFVYPLGEKISRSDYEYAETGAWLYLAIQEAVSMAKLSLKVPKKVIKRYQRKRIQPSLL